MSSRRLATSHHTFEVKKLEICARSSTPGKSMGALIHDSSTKSWEANKRGWNPSSSRRMADGVMGKDLFTREVFLQWDMDCPALSTLRELKPPPKW